MNDELVRMWNKWWWRILRYSPGIHPEKMRKATKDSVRISRLLAEI
jgi:hypothetical protein